LARGSGKTDSLATPNEENMSEELKPMTVQEIRADIAKPKVIVLPSGKRIKVRRLTPMDYIKEGLSEIPNEFYKFVVDLQAGTLDFNSDENKQKKNFEVFEKFVNITIDKGVIDPLMAFKYDKAKRETHLLYSELLPEDQTVLINAIIGK
jgi:hypothetical protein